MISEQTLLEGAWWAMEQAGRLMTAAYDAGDQSTAVVLALFSREEIGRSKLLRELAETVANGTPCERTDLRSALEQHLAKQKAGALNVGLRNEPRLKAPLQRQASTEVGSADWLATWKEIEGLVAEHEERAPKLRHSLRMAALYVDLDASGSAWKLPRTLEPSELSIAVTEAANDYTIASANLRPGTIEHIHPRMADALTKMTERPALPPPILPKTHRPPITG